jgi:hypothetical protein
MLVASTDTSADNAVPGRARRRQAGINRFNVNFMKALLLCGEKAFVRFIVMI